MTTTSARSGRTPIWALCERALGRLAQALALHEENLAGYLRALGPEHRDTLNSRNNIGEPIGPWAITSSPRRCTSGTTPIMCGCWAPTTWTPDTSRNNLATACRGAGRFGEAIALHRQNLADRTRVLGRDHWHTLQSRNNLAQTLQAAGRYRQALSLQCRAS